MGMRVDPIAIHLDPFQRVGKFAARVVAAGEEHPMAGYGALLHTAGVGCMGGNQKAVVKLNVGKKTFVATNKSPFDEWSRDFQNNNCPF
jgi:hypothetical protein